MQLNSLLGLSAAFNDKNNTLHTTVTRTNTDGSMKIEAQEDIKLKRKSAWQISHELIPQINTVVEQQNQQNNTNEVKLPVPVVLGWRCLNPKTNRPYSRFCGIHKTRKKYSSNSTHIEDHERRQRDGGAIKQAVLAELAKVKAHEKCKLRYTNADFGSYATLAPGKLNICEREKECGSLLKNGIDEQALKYLQTKYFQLGMELAITQTELSGTIIQPNGDLNTRYIQHCNPEAGHNQNMLITLPGVRKAFADGFRLAAGVGEDQIMCIKNPMVEDRERWLVNPTVAESKHLLCKADLMQLKNVKEPYC